MNATSTRPGVAFTGVVQGRVTEFLDVEALLRAADRNPAQPAPEVAACPLPPAENRLPLRIEAGEKKYGH